MALFRSKVDIGFTRRIARELIENVVGEKVTYYPISKRFSNENFYGESKEKIVDPPVELYSLIEWQDQEVSTTDYGQDVVYKLRVFVHEEHLERIELDPTEGDMIDFNGVKFEITEITVPDLIFGRSGENVGRRLECVSVRDNTFKISVSASVDQPKRTAPDEPAGNKSFYERTTFPFSSSC